MASLVRESSTEYKLLQYQEELAKRHQMRWFEQHSIECPGCGDKVIIPPNDYLCVNCRCLTVDVAVA